MVDGPPDLPEPEALSEPPAAEEPETESPTQDGAMDQFDRRAMVGAIYSPCFVRAIAKRRLGDLDRDNAVFAVAVSDGSEVATIAVQIATTAADGEAALHEIVEQAVEQAAADFPRETRLADIIERSPLKLGSPTPVRPTGLRARAT